ncbi:TIGR03862 family flavoprotein [Sulfurivermis fontis]|uniref:TIGR03862 family flavoprotein n=1 Tax=Sulfurivermis fontis TaxID=1972068 RepID=UPI000FDB0D19|nr:TIGR03862 family flavoprotein [Sulfurivermis fontis]
MSEAPTTNVAVIGGGPAGLMAAEVLAAAGVQVDVYDAMPSVGRKFLMAGKGGMNITHSESLERFIDRYGARREYLAPLLARFGPDALRAWIHDLGIATFVGSSGRVFPADMKAAPLLRAWLHRLRSAGVRFHVRHRWLGWDAAGALRFASPSGEVVGRPAATVLALGGGSWARLGSDGAWVPLLQGRGIAVAPLRPSNCGFEVAWSEHLRTRHAGQPVKPVVVSFAGERRQGELMVTEYGVEGGVVYALSAPLREAIAAEGRAVPLLDLVPGREQARLAADLARPRGRDSLAKHLRRHAGIDGVKAGLLRELVPVEVLRDPARLAAALKALPLPLRATRPLDEAISSAGGVRFEALDEHLMLRGLPGVFCAGEMLDWEAPTGGYLLTACFASGRAAGEGVRDWLVRRRGKGRPALASARGISMP